MVITPEEFKLVEKRLEAWNEKIGIANFRLGELTKEDMLEHVKAKDDVGQALSEIQLHYLRKLKERR